VLKEALDNPVDIQGQSLILVFLRLQLRLQAPVVFAFAFCCFGELVREARTRRPPFESIQSIRMSRRAHKVAMCEVAGQGPLRQEQLVALIVFHNARIRHSCFEKQSLDLLKSPTPHILRLY
jgi:hypothetical protein